ncbi:hypothetical protein [Rhizobium sp. SSA_523]|uniref:hypothetical protein n=1 Tax=Rhizobium sp. SSA_523 TaxID=2952477 RepID=UPI0020909E1E|nr:hypothetical protein [Rhizobium sp. SSA_523]MCO5730126.1 hypothetical protein [Rhizobium sp. SSA_523]WKC25191.1 hypothetical protein QTJ18_14480 [Rhizobium sp. SSA_523]
MNEFGYDVRPVAGGGYHAMLRTAADGELKPIVGKGGKPLVYHSLSDALHSLLGHLTRYVNGHLVREGEIAGQTEAAAQAHFKPIVRQKGKTRVIAVAYKKGSFRCKTGDKNAKAADVSSVTPTEPSTSPGCSGS